MRVCLCVSMCFCCSVCYCLHLKNNNFHRNFGVHFHYLRHILFHLPSVSIIVDNLLVHVIGHDVCVYKFTRTHAHTQDMRIVFIDHATIFMAYFDFVDGHLDILQPVDL